MSAVYNYMEPFSAECRAFGRLHESDHQELAVKCFGYVLLDEEHERAMMAQCNLNYWSFNGDIDFAGAVDEDMDMRRRFLGKSGRPPPIRCIVKAFGPVIKFDEEQRFQERTARQLLRDIVKLQKLGIMQIDVAVRQLVDGRFSDFSTAVTMPHFMTSPELNPNLTPPMIEQLNQSTFASCVNDYLDFDSMVHEWNEDYGEDKGHMSIQAYPGGRGILQSLRYNLRPRGKGTKKPLYTFVNPRDYGWSNALAEQGPQVTRRRLSARISKSTKRQTLQGKASKSQPKKLTARPRLWHYDYQKEDEHWAGSVRASVITIGHYIEWSYRDGHIIPTTEDGFSPEDWFVEGGSRSIGFGDGRPVVRGA